MSLRATCYYGAVSTPILVSGSVAIDRIMSFDGVWRDHIRPEKLDSISISLFLDELQDTYGGVGGNISYSLALLGNDPILVASAGPDATAYLEKLAHDGVNITHVFESKLPTASFSVMTDGEQNQVGGFYPGAMTDCRTLTLEPWKDIDPLVVVAPHWPDAMRRQVAECRQWGLRLVYDPGQQVANLPGEDLAEGVRAAEVLILNDYELAVLSHKSGMDVATIKQTVPVVITTLGKKGSVIEGARVPKPITVGIAKPKHVADPTGAGDAFRGGFLHGYVRGWDLQTSAQLGAVTACYAIEFKGTQNHRFDLKTAAARYKQSFGADLPADKKGRS